MLNTGQNSSMFPTLSETALAWPMVLPTNARWQRLGSAEGVCSGRTAC